MVLLEDFTLVLQKSAGCKIGEHYYGVWENYPFSAQVEQSREPGRIAFLFRLPATLEGGLFKTIQKSFPKGCQLVAASGSCYRLVCHGKPLRQEERSLSSLLSLLTRSLREAGIAPSDVCPVCGQSGCDAYADLGGYTAVHRACVESMADQTQARARSAVRSGNYFTGFLGALLGGLVASIPTIIAQFAGYLVGYLYALIPLGAYYGYKLFRGRMNRGAFVCTLLASIFHLFSIEQIYFYIWIHQRYDIWPSLLDTVALYFQRMGFADIVESMGMSVLFMGLGLWISWGSIRRNAFTDVGTVQSVHATLTDKPAPLF